MEGIHDLIVFAGIGEGDLPALDLSVGCFDYIVDRLATACVDGVEVEDLVLAVIVPDDVAQDGVDAQGSVGDKDDRVEGRVEKGCDGCAGLVEDVVLLVANEGVRTGFGSVLVGTEFGLDYTGVGSEGALGLKKVGSVRNSVEYDAQVRNKMKVTMVEVAKVGIKEKVGLQPRPKSQEFLIWS